MTTARAKGIRGRLVLIRHGFKNALIPIITIIGLTLPDLVAGAVITESCSAGRAWASSRSRRPPAAISR